MLLKPQKRSVLLFQSYLVALGIGGAERYRWLEEVLEENHVYQIFPVLYMKKPFWSMTLFFKRMLYWSIFKLLKEKKKKNRYGSFATKEGEVVKCSLCEGNHDLDDCNSFSQFDLRKGTKRLFHSKLCYDCLSAISVNHNARNCKNRMDTKFVKKTPTLSAWF